MRLYPRVHRATAADAVCHYLEGYKELREAQACLVTRVAGNT